MRGISSHTPAMPTRCSPLPTTRSSTRDACCSRDLDASGVFGKVFGRLHSQDRTEGFIPGLQCFAWLNPRVDRRSSPMQPAWQGFVFGCRELDRHCSQRTSKPAILILGVTNSDRHGQLKILSKEQCPNSGIGPYFRRVPMDKRRRSRLGDGLDLRRHRGGARDQSRRSRSRGRRSSGSADCGSAKRNCGKRVMAHLVSSTL